MWDLESIWCPLKDPLKRNIVSSVLYKTSLTCPVLSSKLVLQPIPCSSRPKSMHFKRKLDCFFNCQFTVSFFSFSFKQKEAVRYKSLNFFSVQYIRPATRQSSLDLGVFITPYDGHTLSGNFMLIGPNNWTGHSMDKTYKHSFLAKTFTVAHVWANNSMGKMDGVNCNYILSNTKIWEVLKREKKKRYKDWGIWRFKCWLFVFCCLKL